MREPLIEKRPMDAPALTFDDTALRAPVDATRARAEASSLRRGAGGRVGEVAGLGWVVVQSVVLVAGLGILVALAVLVVQMIFGAYGANVLTIVIAALIVLPFAIIRVRGVMASRRATEAAWYRLTRFAAANGLTFELIEPDPQGAAALYRVGKHRVATDIIDRPGAQGPTVSSYAFDTFVGRTRMPHAHTVVRFGLKSRLPSFVIATKTRGLVGRAWEDAPWWHTLPIEASFDERIEVRCAPRDADAVRGILTPLVRQALALAAYADVEVTGTEVFVVTRSAVPTADPAFWQWVGELAGMVRLLDGAPDPAAELAIAREDDARSHLDALFTSPPVAKTAAVGCLVPLLIGLTAAAVLTLLGVAS